MQTATQQAPAPAPVPMAAHVAVNRYATIEQAAQLRPAFTAAALRDIRFKADDRLNSRGDVIKGNGTAAAGVWVQVGRKVIVDLDAFDRWIESQKQVAA